MGYAIDIERYSDFFRAFVGCENCLGEIATAIGSYFDLRYELAHEGHRNLDADNSGGANKRFFGCYTQLSCRNLGHLFGVDHALCANCGVRTTAVCNYSPHSFIDSNAITGKCDRGRQDAVLRKSSSHGAWLVRNQKTDIEFVGTGSLDSCKDSSSRKTLG